MPTVLLLLIGCFGAAPDRGETPTVVVPDPGGTPPYGGGFLEGEFCDVQSVYQVACVVGCHSAEVVAGGLDLDTDPHGATVGVQGDGGILVSPGNPAGSVLYSEMIGEGGSSMPPSGLLDGSFTGVIGSWISNGALDDCQQGGVDTGGTPTPPDDAPYHPLGWEEGGVHGVANNLQQDKDCRECHGQQLDGGTSDQSCDECHDPGWRTNCTFCHGGVDNLTGAPPEDIDNNPVSTAFPPHTEHVTGQNHPPYGCTQCHAQRFDVLTPGHIFDDVTAGYGELYYNNGLSQYATYLFGTCSNMYCHGSGRADDGVVTVGQTMYCTSCHPDAETSVEAQWEQMSGRHADHLDEGILCYECHSTTTNANQQIINPLQHVDGVKNVVPIGVVWNGATCTGECHNEAHDNENW